MSFARASFSCDASTIFHAFSISRLSDAIVFWSSCDSLSAVCTFAAFATISCAAKHGPHHPACEPSARIVAEGRRVCAAAAAHLVELAALLDQPLLRFVALLERAVQLVVLGAEALEALVADELLQHLRWRVCRGCVSCCYERAGLRRAGASGELGAHLLEVALERLEGAGLEARRVQRLLRLRLRLPRPV